MGLISLTCDAWQGGNEDAYFAVTGHWIEEVSPGDWEYNSTLLGFTQMNTAHDSVRLGRALFKFVRCLGFSQKVLYCHYFFGFHCQFLRCLSQISLIHVSRCLVYVINLATQALLSGHSSAKHYDP